MGAGTKPRPGEMVNYEIPPEIEEQRNDVFEQTSKQYEKVLEDLQIVLIVDKSGSMRTPDENYTGKDSPGFSGGWTRWDNTFMLAKDLADSLFKYDKDSEISVIFFGNSVKSTKAHTSSQLLSLFKQNAPTNETTNLLAALRTAFVENINTDQTLFIVLTDGQPNKGQESKVKNLIQDMVTRQDPGGDRLNVLFIRIGDDPGAIDFLQDLDDCARIGDNVDTKSDNEAFVLGPRCLVLNAIFEHLEGDMDKYVPALPTLPPLPGFSGNKKGGRKGGRGGGGIAQNMQPMDFIWIFVAIIVFVIFFLL